MLKDIQREARVLRAKYHDQIVAAAQVIQAGVEAVTLVQQAAMSPTLAAVNLAARAVEAVSGEGSIDIQTLLVGFEWIPAQYDTLLESLEDVWEITPSRVIHEYEGSVLREYTIDGVTFRTVTRGGGIGSPQLYVRRGELNPAVECLRRILWSKFGRAVVLAPHPTLQGYTTLLPLEQNVARDSALAQELVTYVRKYLDANVSRAIMLVGPSGTGKTTAAAFVAQEIAHRSLVIRPDVIDSANDLVSVVSALRPDAIVIDDMDRARHASKQMSAWEAVRAICPLVIASANNTGKLDYALLRPGRFDRLVEVVEPPTGTREAVLGELQGELPTELVEQAQALHVAYYSEWAQAIRVEGVERAEGLLAEMLERQALVDSAWAQEIGWDGYEDDDNEA